MTETTVPARKGLRGSVRKWIAGTAAGVLVAGTLVTVGVGAQQAMAAAFAPGVAVTEPASYIAGEDLTLGLTFSSPRESTPQYNLSFGVVLDKNVTFLEADPLLGVPVIYDESTLLPGVIASGATPGACEELGLAKPTGAGAAAGSCMVPVGKQYLVFQNIADLPAGVTLGGNITLRPQANPTFPVGSDFPYQVNASTSSEPRYIPVFPGSTGVNTDGAVKATSGTGAHSDSVPVNALRIEKSEPSPESELLRGVHNNVTTYTLDVYHTGEGDIADATVVDFIPAGLEYLGLGGADNTKRANGTREESAEYPGAASLTATPAPEEVGSWQTAGELVETVIPTEAEVKKYGLTAGAVYTKVTWNLGKLLANTDDRGNPKGVKQSYAGTAGTPGVITIKYQAAVPLFENTLDFGYEAKTTGQQASNLDNNRGASTRHGSNDLEDRKAPAKSYTNVAVASGNYDKAAVEDFDSEVIEAVDVRILKTVATEGFTQTGLARYTLKLATSEYVSATIGNPMNTGDKANDVLRLVDDMADGLCPVFGPNTKIWDGSSTHGATVPNLVLGNYNVPGSEIKTNQTPHAWNDALAAAGVDSACAWDASVGTSIGASDGATKLDRGFLTGIAFDEVTGRFMLEYALDPENALAQANAKHELSYSVRQNKMYTAGGSGGDGATTSMDSFENIVEINARTTPIDAVNGVDTPGGTATPGDWNAWDDSEAVVRAGDTKLTKHVLPRDAFKQAGSEVAKIGAGKWVKTVGQNTPFAVGDQTWYKISITPPTGADVRNPVFTDFLPEGVSFDAKKDSTGRHSDMWIVPGGEAGNLPWLGSCKPTTSTGGEVRDWLNTFVPMEGITQQGQMLQFNLGSADCFGTDSSDRFLPFAMKTLDIYLKVTVTEPSSFTKLDMPQNLAKFRYNNASNEVFALRDQAEIEADRIPQLLKGVASVKPNVGEVSATRAAKSQASSNGADFNSNRDGIEVVQGEEVTYRLDITAPYSTTSGYQIWDVLPEGIEGNEVLAGSRNAKLVVDGIETNDFVGFEADIYSFEGIPDSIKAQLKDKFKEEKRSVIVWTINDAVPASTKAIVDAEGNVTTPAVERGLTLSYTVTVPNGAGAAGALIGQSYDNDASIVQFDSVSNAGEKSTLFIDGTENVVNAPAETDLTDGQFVWKDEANDTSDDSNIYASDVAFKKTLISTEVGPDPSVTPAGLEHLDQNNGNGQIVQGELATYELEVTVPAHTTVRNGVLKDSGELTWTGNPNVNNRKLEYHVASAQVWNVPGAVEDGTGTLPTGWAFSERTGELKFPEYYQNKTSDVQKIQVRLTVWIDARDASHSGDNASDQFPNFDQREKLTNTATFNSKNAVDGDNTTKSANATVEYVKPELAISKSASKTANVAPGDTVTYTLNVSNAANRPKSYDNAVVDTVPVDLQVKSGSFKINGQEVPDEALVIDAGVLTGAGGTITWAYSDDVNSPLYALKEIPTTALLTYEATVHPRTGGGKPYENTAIVEGYTLPTTIASERTTDRRGDRVDDAAVTITAATAEITKGVRVAGGNESYAESVTAPIGETVEYQVVTTLFKNINYYNATLTDTFAGADTNIGKPVRAVVSGPKSNPADTVLGNWKSEITGQTIEWTLAGDDPHIVASGVERTLTVTYQVTLKDAIKLNALPNKATFSWTQEEDKNSTPGSVTDDAKVNIIDPLLSLEKDVKFNDGSAWGQQVSGTADRTLNYQITVENIGESTSFENIMVDTLPAGVINPRDFKIDGDEVGVPNAVTVEERTITWSVPGGILVGDAEKVTLSYTADFAGADELSNIENPAPADPAKIGVGKWLTNTVEVTAYESWPRDLANPDTPTGREGDTDGIEADAEVQPLFPYVIPTKTVSVPVGTNASGEGYGVAYIGEEFGWTLTFVNTGAGAAQTLAPTDILPANWEYVAKSAEVRIGTGAYQVIEPVLVTPETGELGKNGKQTLRWELGTAGSVDPLLPGTVTAQDVDARTVTIKFNAIPNMHAIDDAGTGIIDLADPKHPHTNTVSAETTDLRGNTANKSGSFTGPNDTANAHIAEADLLLDKAAIGGTQNGAHDLPDGSWVPGMVAGDDYAQPQWELTVTNHGPDASFGPFTVVEKQTLPKDVTVSDWVATYYPADGSEATSLDIDGVTTDADLTLKVGDAKTSLDASGDDRIVITANVNIPAGVQATAAQLKNVAYVESETFERDANKNPEKDPKNPNQAEAGKPLTSVADLAIEKTFTGETENLNAGDLVNWTLRVTNHGPDHSRSTAGEGNQIVVFDDVPSEIVDFVPGPLPAGWTVAISGQEITATLKPVAQLNSGASVDFSFTGRIGGDVAAGTEITNTATVTPGETPDPVEPNNTDSDKVGPKTAHTSVAAMKQRVVHDEASKTWHPADDTEVTAGSTVSYRLQLTNTGEFVPARGITLSDELPSYLTLKGWEAETPRLGWTRSEDGQPLSFTNPEAVIAPGASASVIITATVAADHRGDVENTVCVTTGNLDPNQSTLDDCATDSTGFDKSVDWELLKSHVTPAAGDPAVAGETVRYRLVLNNHGPSVSDGPITITDVLPAGFSYAANVVATGAVLSEAVVDGQQITWTAEGPAGAQFAVGESVVTVEFDALVAENASAGAYENTARVDGPDSEPDTNPTNNEDTDEVPVIRDAQLHIDKQVLSVDTGEGGAWGETAEHAAGTTVTWRVKVTNSGSSAVPVTFTDDLALAPGVTLTGLDGGSDWQCDTDAQQCAYVANDGLFPVTHADESNASWITITTELAANVAPTEAPGLVNWGKITWVDNTTNPDLPDGGNSASDDASITTVRAADLGLIKQVRDAAPEADGADAEWIDANSADDAGSVTAGESTSYRVLISNHGPSDAVAPLVVTDTLPAGATFAGIIAAPNESGKTEWSADYDADAHTVTFTRNADFGGLAVGADALTLEYEVSFDSALEAGSVLENTAELGSETLETNGDSNPENNSDPANVRIERQIDLGIEKSHDADRVRIGDELPFTVDVTNHGPSEATGVVVTDTVPAGLDVVTEPGELLDENDEPTGWTIESVTVNEEDGTTAVVASYAHPLAPGAAATPLVITTLVTPVAYETVTNVVDVEANEPEPSDDTENPNHAEDPVVVPPQVTLVVEKSAVGQFKVGQVGTYEIVVSNHGPTLDPGPITVTDALPKGLSFNAAPDLPAGATVDHSRGVVTWTLAEPLAVGDQVKLTLKVNVHQAAYDQPNHEITNTVVIDSESELTPDSVLEDDATVKVTPADQLVLTGTDIAGGVLAALALLLLGGAAVYTAGRRRKQAGHAA